jgi:hypothetical protein
VPAVAFKAQAHVIRVTECLDARVEPATGVEFTVPQELDFGAGRLAVVAQCTRDCSAVSFQRPHRLGGALPPWRSAVSGRVPLIGHALTIPQDMTGQVRTLFQSPPT